MLLAHGEIQATRVIYFFRLKKTPCSSEHLGKLMSSRNKFVGLIMATVHLCFSPPIPVWKVVPPPIGDGAVQISYPVLCRVALELCLGI